MVLNFDNTFSIDLNVCSLKGTLKHLEHFQNNVCKSTFYSIFVIHYLKIQLFKPSNFQILCDIGYPMELFYRLSIKYVCCINELGWKIR